MGTQDNTKSHLKLGDLVAWRGDALADGQGAHGIVAVVSAGGFERKQLTADECRELGAFLFAAAEGAS